MTQATLPIHIYVIELVFGIAGAMAYPAWMGLHSTTTELSSAATAVVGGFLAEKLGFNYLWFYLSFIPKSPKSSRRGFLFGIISKPWWA